MAVVDKRTQAARGYISTRQGLLENLGGPEAVSEAQAHLVEIVCRGLLYLDHVDAVLLERRSLLNKRGTKLLPLLVERTRMADSLARQLQTLGLEKRKQPPMDLSTYLAQRAAQQASTERTEPHTNPSSTDGDTPDDDATQPLPSSSRQPV